VSDYPRGGRGSRGSRGSRGEFYFCLLPPAFCLLPSQGEANAF